MDKIKILHTADVHLKAKDGGASFQAFAKILSIAKDEKVDALLLAGDLFDSAFASVSDKNYVMSMFSQLGEIPIFMVAGNHDSLPCYRDVEFPPNVHFFGDSISKFSIGNVDIYGVSLPYNHYEGSLIDGFRADNPSAINILVMHGDINASGSPFHPFTSGQLESSGIDYAALGHVHTSGGILRAGSTHYAYSGVPQGRGFDEAGEKGVWVGDIYKGHADLKFVRTCLYTYDEITIDITGMSDYAQIAEKIRESTADGCGYKIHLKGLFEGGFILDPDRIADMLGDCFVKLKIIDETGAEADLEKIREEYSLRGLFVKKMLESGASEAAVNYGLAALDGKKIEVAE